MNSWSVIFDLVLLLLAALVLGAIAERLRQSAIVGFLLAGMLLGPNALGWVGSEAEVEMLAELGVALLLFAIGLEFSWRHLRALGASALRGGVVQVIATMAAVVAVALVAGQPGRAAVALGAIIALSSTASVLHVLRARAELDTVHGGYALAILLVQDLAVVPLVLLVSVLSDGGSALAITRELGKALALGAILVVGLYVVFNRLAPRMLGFGPMYGNRDLAILLAVTSGLGSALLAHSVGLSPALGAFVAGLLLGESPFAIQIRADVSSLKTIFVTIFFTSIGMLGDAGWMLANWNILLGTVLAIIVGKSVLAWGTLRLFGATTVSALAAGICLGQIGEFSFILSEIARGSLISDDVFQLLVSSTVLTMLLTPYLVASAPKVAGRLAGAGRHADASLVGPRAVPSRLRTLVIGFGPAGRVVAEQLRKDDPWVTILDLNPHLVAEARRLGFEAFVGDAQHEDVLKHVDIQSATVVAVTVPAPEVAIQIVRLIRGIAPQSFIVARARYNRFLRELEDAGAYVAHDEETYVGLRMAESVKELFVSRENTIDVDDEPRHADGRL